MRKEQDLSEGLVEACKSRRGVSSNYLEVESPPGRLANRPEQYRQFRGGSWLSKTSSNSSRDIEIVAQSHEPQMKFIFFSARLYTSDFRKFLIEALRAAGHEAWHVRVGRCNKLTSIEGSEEFCGIAGLLGMIRHLRIIGANVYVDSTGAVTPLRSILFRAALRGGTWCFDIFDNLLYDYRGYRLFKARISIKLLTHSSRILLVLSSESLRLFPSARHLDNAADIPRVNRRDRNFRDLVVLASIDQRFDFEFVREIARLSPAHRIVIHGHLHDNEISGRRLAELCAQQTNIVYNGKYELDDIPAILDPYAIGLTPYAVGSRLTEFVNPDKYYMFLQGGLEVISTDIPQARRMGERIHLVRSPAEVIEVALRIEQDRTFRKNTDLGPDYSWSRRAHDLVEIVNAAKAGEEGQRAAIQPMLQVSRPVSRLGPVTQCCKRVGWDRSLR
jgi:hypothetical protein